MATTTEHFCDRCGEGPLTGRWHDGSITLSSIVNRQDIFGDADTYELAFCDPCYRMWHAGMRAFMRGGEITVKRPLRPPDPPPAPPGQKIA